MPAWSGKTRGGITGYKIFVFFIKYLGLGFAYFMLFFVVFYFMATSPAANKAAWFYFRKIHKYNLIKSGLFVFKNYYVFGQTLIDKLVMLSGHNKKLVFEFDGEEYLHQMAAEKGGMLISAHIGSFEIAGYLLKRINTPVNILMFEAEHAHIKNFLSSIYKDLPTRIISIKDDMSHLYEIKRVFENKEFLCLHGDRFLDGTKTISHLFMGKEALFPAGPFYMAMKYNVPVTFVFAMKESTFRYHFYATPPKIYHTAKINLKKKEMQLTDMLGDYINAFEKVLKKYPAQWFNFYYFWGKNSKA